MDILVLLKNVPEVAEADLEINDDGDGLELDELVLGINEWDNYAVEEAVRLKEDLGGTVTVLTIGDDEAEDVLRRGLAMGADEAVHLNDEALEGSDPAGLARCVAAAIKDKSFDLILSGVQSSDSGNAQTGVLLAQILNLPYATMAIGLKADDNGFTVTRELEANTTEQVSLPRPALVTIQSGINQPRYVSIMGIRKVRKLAVDLMELDDLGLDEDQVGPEASALAARRLSPPPVGDGAQMLEGPLAQVCEQVAGILRDKGGVA